MAELKLCKVCKTNMLIKFFQSNPKTDIKAVISVARKLGIRLHVMNALTNVGVEVN